MPSEGTRTVTEISARTVDERASDLAHGATTFVIVWEDTHVSAHTEADISRMFDLADCDQMDGVAAVLAVGNDGTLRPVTTGKSRRVDSDDEYPLYYATAPLVTDDGHTVGYVHFSDH